MEGNRYEVLSTLKNTIQTLRIIYRMRVHLGENRVKCQEKQIPCDYTICKEIEGHLAHSSGRGNKRALSGSVLDCLDKATKTLTQP